MLIDSHCHLDHKALAQDREGVIARARAAGVARMINISTTRHDSVTVRETAEAHEDVFCTVGSHPHHVAEAGENFTTDELIALAKHPKVVGIGETGLDYYYNHSPRAEQQQSFRHHIHASVASGLPLIIHSRDAEEDTIKILREEMALEKANPSPAKTKGLPKEQTQVFAISPAGGEEKVRGVMHCFSSRRVLAEDALALGFYISLSGILTFKKSQELRDIARDVPMDRLLVETDSPFLAPEPFRGRPCEPAYVVNTARVLAEVKGVSPEEIARATTENFFRLFSKVKPL